MPAKKPAAAAPTLYLSPASDWASLPDQVADNLFRLLHGVAAHGRFANREFPTARLVCRRWAANAVFQQKHITGNACKPSLPGAAARDAWVQDKIAVWGLHCHWLVLDDFTLITDTLLNSVHRFTALKSLELHRCEENFAHRLHNSVLDREYITGAIVDKSAFSSGLVSGLLPSMTLSRLLIDGGCGFVDDVFLHRLHSLDFLFLRHSSLERMPGAAAMTMLTVLHLECCPLHPDAFLELGAMASLTRLYLSSVCAKHKDAWRELGARHPTPGFVCFTSLTQINWTDDGYDCDIGALVACMTGLRSLCLVETRVTGPSASAWRMPHLYALDVRNCFRGGLIDADLGRLTALTTLNLARADARDATVASLLSLTRLTDLNLDGCGLTGASIDSLVLMTRLQKLNLRYNTLPSPPSATAARLRDALPNLHHLQYDELNYHDDGWLAAFGDGGGGDHDYLDDVASESSDDSTDEESSESDAEEAAA
jgi:Leucine-rich repeat (LRR) protein